MENKLVTVWSGRTEYFDEILDSLICAGIKCESNPSNWTIKVQNKDIDQANGILMELNSFLQAGW